MLFATLGLARTIVAGWFALSYIGMDAGLAAVTAGLALHARAIVARLYHGDGKLLGLIALYVLHGDGFAEVSVAQGELHVAQGDAVDMAEEESPCRQFAKHGKFGILVLIFRHLGHLHISHTLVCPAGSRDADVFQQHILHGMPRPAGDARWERIVEVAHLRATDIIVGIWTAKGQFYVQVADDDVADVAAVVACTVAEFDKDGVARIPCLQAVDHHAVNLRSVHALDGDA